MKRKGENIDVRFVSTVVKCDTCGNCIKTTGVESQGVLFYDARCEKCGSRKVETVEFCVERELSNT